MPGRSLHALAPAIAFGAVAVGGLSGAVPLTWDEAWNFVHVSSRGLGVVFGSYEMPNNHVLFSAVQSLLPDALVLRWPPALRLVNAAVACALGAVLGSLLQREQAWRAALLALCAPLFTLYLAVGRGYLPGTLLLLLAAASAAREQPLRTGLFAGLSACCVPTFALAVPGLSLALRRGRAPALAVFAAMTFLCYARIASEVFRQRSLWGAMPGAFLPGLVAGGWQLASMGLLVAAGAVALALRREARWTPLALGLLGACGSYLSLVVVLGALGVLDAPYPRSGLFIPLFAWLALLLAAQGRASAAATGLLGVSAAVGLAVLVLSFGSGGDPNRYPYLRTLTPTPLQRAIGQQADALSGEAAAAPLLELYSRALGAPRVAPGPLPAACALGTVRPEPPQAVVLHRGSAALLLCY